MGNGKGELYVVVMNLPHLGLKMLVHEDQEQTIPSIYRNATDAELRAARMRERVPNAKFHVVPVTPLGVAVSDEEAPVEAAA